MVNLGAEVSRIISALEHNEKTTAHEALERAKKILRTMREMPDMKSRVIELEALGSALNTLLAENKRESVSSAHIKSYFTPFAVRFFSLQSS